MNEQEKQWHDELQKLQSEAFEKLRTFAFAWNKESGFTTAKHVVDYIKRLDNQVLSQLGDCP